MNPSCPHHRPARLTEPCPAPQNTRRGGVRSGEFDEAGVTDGELVRAGHRAASTHLGTHADQAVLQAFADVLDLRALVHHAVLDLRTTNHRVRADARERPDVRVLNHHALTQHDGSNDLAADHPGRRGNHHPPRDPGVGHLTLHVVLQSLEEQTVGIEQIGRAAGVLPPALHGLTLDVQGGVDQALDAVGDLEFAPGGRRHAVEHVEDLGRETVQTSDGEVAGGILGFLDEAGDAGAVELGDAEGGGVRDLHEGDQGTGTVLLEGVDEGGGTMLEEVVAEVDAEVVLGDPIAGGEDGVPEAELLVLVDEGDAHAGEVLDGVLDFGAGDVGDDDADVSDAGVHEGVDGVGDDGLTSNAQDRFRTRVGQGTQARAQPRRRNDSFHPSTLCLYCLSSI